MTSNSNLSSNSFQNLSESQQNSLIFKRLCELTFKVNQIQEDVLSVKANGIEGRQQLDKVLTIAQPTILNSLKKFEFREESKIDFTELSKYFDHTILPSVKQFLHTTHFLKELHTTIKNQRDEFDEDGDYVLSNDVRNRLSYLLYELKKSGKITAIEYSDPRTIRKEWTGFLNRIWKKSGLFHPHTPQESCLVRDSNSRDVADYISTHVFMWLFHGQEVLGNLPIITTTGTVFVSVK